MPFELPGADQHATWWPEDRSTNPEIVLRQVSPTTFQLLEGFRFAVPHGAAYTVPPHDPGEDPGAANNSTDLASVPQILWWFFASYGAHTRAALLHDHFVDAPENGKPTTRARRHEIDRVFELALADAHVRWVRRKLVWTAVSLRTSWGERGFAVVVLHLVALASSVVYWLVADRLERLPLALAAAGFVWGLRPPLGAVKPGLRRTKLTAVLWGLARWPIAVVGFSLVAMPTTMGILTRLAVWAGDLAEEGLTFAVRWIVRAINSVKDEPIGIVNLDRTIQLPKLEPYKHSVGPF